MWVRRLHPEDRERVLRQFRDACASGGASPRSTGSSTARGGSLWWRDEGRALPGPDGAARFVRGLRARRHGAEAGRGVAAQAALLRPADRAAEPRAAPEPARPGPRRVRADGPAARPADPGPRPLPRDHEHARPPQRRPDRARAGRPARRRARRRRPRRTGCGATSSACCCPTPTPRSPGRSASASSARSSGRSWCSGCPIEVSASVGMAVAPEHGTEAETLLRHADVGGAGGAEAGRRSERPLLVRAASRTTPRGSPSSASCAARSTATSCSCTTSRRSTSRPARWWGRRRSCAGRTRSAGFVSPGGLHPARGADRASSARSRGGCSTARRGRRGAGSGRGGRSRWP